MAPPRNEDQKENIHAHLKIFLAQLSGHATCSSHSPSPVSLWSCLLLPKNVLSVWPLRHSGIRWSVHSLIAIVSPNNVFLTNVWTWIFSLTLYKSCFLLLADICCGACSPKVEFEEWLKPSEGCRYTLRLLFMEVGGDNWQLEVMK